MAPQSTALPQTSFEFGLNGFIFIFKISMSSQDISTSFIVPTSLIFFLTVKLDSSARGHAEAYSPSQWLNGHLALSLNTTALGKQVLGTSSELSHTGGRLLIRTASHPWVQVT